MQDKPITEPVIALDLRIRKNRIVSILFFITGGLILAHIGVMVMFFAFGHSNVLGLSPLFNLDREKNIPTLFQTIILASNALLLQIITLLEIKRKSSIRGYWIILTIGLILMTIDEWLQFHERLIKPVQNIIGTNNLGVFTFSWVIVGILLVLLLAFVFRKFLIKLPKQNRQQLLMAALVYLSGAIGFELVGGYIVSIIGFRTIFYFTAVLFEEGLEMCGMVLFARCLFNYLEQFYRMFSLTVSMVDEKRPQKEPPIGIKKTRVD